MSGKDHYLECHLAERQLQNTSETRSTGAHKTTVRSICARKLAAACSRCVAATGSNLSQLCCSYTIRHCTATVAGPPAKRAAVLEALEDVPKPLAIEDGGESDSGGGASSSSSSSSTSSSGKKKKSKKSKKDKKAKKSKKDKKGTKDKKEKRAKNADREESVPERKAREALERAREKEEQKRLDSFVKVSQELLKKMPTVVGPLQALLNSDGFADVAPVIRTPVTAAVDKFERLLNLAQKTVAAGAKNSDAGDVPLFSSLAPEIAAVKKSSALLSSILATMAKAARM